jgi:lipopolysaccharide export system permease protein
MPYVISYALPMGVLMGVLLVLGKMCARGEYTAYRASGVSIGYLSAPIWVFALLGVMLLMAINFYYAPNARGSYYTTMAQTIRSDPLRFILPQTFVKEFPGYILYARERDEKILRDFWIWELDEHNRPLKLVRAREGTLNYVPEDDSLTLDLKDGFSELRDQKNPDDLKTVRPTLSFDHANVKLTLNRLLTGEKKGGLSVLTLNKLVELEKDQKIKTKQSNEREDKKMLAQVRFQIQQNFAFAFVLTK